MNNLFNGYIIGTNLIAYLYHKYFRKSRGHNNIYVYILDFTFNSCFLEWYWLKENKWPLMGTLKGPKMVGNE